MPRAPEIVEAYPIALEKRDLKQVAALYGHANDRPVEINGRTYEAGKIKFLTFVGAYRGDGIYVGEYRFTHAMPEDPTENFLMKLFTRYHEASDVELHRD